MLPIISRPTEEALSASCITFAFFALAVVIIVFSSHANFFHYHAGNIAANGLRIHDVCCSFAEANVAKPEAIAKHVFAVVHRVWAPSSGFIAFKERIGIMDYHELSDLFIRNGETNILM